MKKTEERDDFARRRAERQKRIRKRRIIIFFIFFIITMLTAGVALSLTVFFPIEKISATGSEIYTGEQIASACGLKNGDNLFRFSTDQLTENLRKSLPYIDSVTIKRSLPGSVSVTVTDAAEFACYNIDGKYYVTSETGFVLNCYDTYPVNVFEVRCNNSVKCEVGKQIEYTDKDTKDILKQMLDNLTDCGIKVNYIDAADKLSLTVKVEDRFIVSFGTRNNLDKKIAHLYGMIKNISPEKTGKINLSMWTSDKTQGSFIEGSIE